jgi:hypothetical protein
MRERICLLSPPTGLDAYSQNALELPHRVMPLLPPGISSRTRLACARAKDMPVFVTWWIKLSPIYPLSILAHQLRRRFLPNSSLLRGARSIYQTARPEGSLVFRPFRPGVWNRSPSKPKPSSALRPFLGRSLPRPASLTTSHKEIREPRRATGRSSLPAPLPGWPRQEPKFSPLPAGGDRTFGHLPRPCAVADSWGGRDFKSSAKDLISLII